MSNCSKRRARLMRIVTGPAFVVIAAAFFRPTPARADAEPTASDPNREVTIAPKAFDVIARTSGPVNYYTTVDHEEAPYIHAAYRPPYKTTVLGYQMPDHLRKSVATLRWKWRAVSLPDGGNECAKGKEDSAAVVYLTWRRGLKWYTLKYVWSAVGPKGATCDRKRNPFRAQETVIVESGSPLGEWQDVTVHPDEEFRNHFEGGNPNAAVPDLIGVGIMSDGDQTTSVSEADYGGFTIVPK